MTYDIQAGVRAFCDGLYWIDHRQRAGVVFHAMNVKEKLMHIDPDYLNAKHASRREDRAFIADTLMELGAKHGGTCERQSEPATPGFCAQSVKLRFDCKGVGAMVSINDLFGGDRALIHWYNTARPSRDFTPEFRRLVSAANDYRPAHKSTSRPDSWYTLALLLDAGLQSAARGEAFQPAG